MVLDQSLAFHNNRYSTRTNHAVPKTHNDHMVTFGGVANSRRLTTNLRVVLNLKQLRPAATCNASGKPGVDLLWDPPSALLLAFDFWITRPLYINSKGTIAWLEHYSTERSILYSEILRVPLVSRYQPILSKLWTATLIFPTTHPSCPVDLDSAHLRNRSPTHMARRPPRGKTAYRPRRRNPSAGPS